MSDLGYNSESRGRPVWGDEDNSDIPDYRPHFNPSTATSDAHSSSNWVDSENRQQYGYRQRGSRQNSAERYKCQRTNSDRSRSPIRGRTQHIPVSPRSAVGCQYPSSGQYPSSCQYSSSRQSRPINRQRDMVDRSPQNRHQIFFADSLGQSCRSHTNERNSDSRTRSNRYYGERPPTSELQMDHRDDSRRSLSESGSLSSKSSETPRFSDDEMQTKEVQDILLRRQKQIDYGKNQECYTRYLELVPRNKRTKHHPRTPDKLLNYSRRGYDMLIKIWKKQLHAWDSPGCVKPDSANVADDSGDFGSFPSLIVVEPIDDDGEQVNFFHTNDGCVSETSPIFESFKIEKESCLKTESCGGIEERTDAVCVSIKIEKEIKSEESNSNSEPRGNDKDLKIELTDIQLYRK